MNQIKESKLPRPKTRERNGCLTCRQRFAIFVAKAQQYISLSDFVYKKKKCDGHYPICKQCQRLNFTCQRNDPRQPQPRAGRPRKVRQKDERPPPRVQPSISGSCACVLIPPSPEIAAF
jgi:hypothetical protein